ncbi:MAG: NAD(P)H-hydrate dehydratase [Pseudomonadota bacterium]
MNTKSRKLYSATQIRELDSAAMEGGIAGHILMQRAGHASWLALQRSRPNARRIDVLCGSGNNGGDGYEIARLANAVGRNVRVWQVGPAPTSGDALTARASWLKAGGMVQPLQPDSLLGAEVIVDALLGIGVKRDLSGDLATAVDAINQAREQGAWVLAIDVPSGLDAGTGRVYGTAVRANMTITFIGNKVGLYTGAGVDCAGEIVLDALNIPAQNYDAMEPLATLQDGSDLAAWLPKRARNSHKGSHGHVLVIGGDSGMSGAALLAGQAALRSGAGLVSLATRGSHALVLTPAQPELMCRRVENVDELTPLMNQATVIAIGPGLGQEAWGRALFARALLSQLPLVVDADALNLLASTSFKRDNWVLTPHPGEAARMLGVTTEEIQNDRPAAIDALQARYGGTVVLKGAGTLIQGHRLSLCPYGNPGMAVAGMGDVLTGMIAACIAQGQALERAANTGVLAHAVAGDRAAAQGMRGLLPTDLLAELRAVVNP